MITRFPFTDELTGFAIISGLLALLFLGFGVALWTRGRNRRRPALAPALENNGSRDFLYDAFASYATRALPKHLRSFAHDQTGKAADIGRSPAVGGHSRAVEIFDLARATKLAEIPLSNPVIDVRFLPGPENRILTLDGFEVGFLRLWDWRSASLIATACARWPESFKPPRNPALPVSRNRRELCGQ